MCFPGIARCSPSHDILPHRCKCRLLASIAHCSCSRSDSGTSCRTCRAGRVCRSSRRPSLFCRSISLSKDDKTPCSPPRIGTPGLVTSAWSVDRNIAEINVEEKIPWLTLAQPGPYKPSSQARLLHVSPTQPEPQMQVPFTGKQVAPFSQLQFLEQFCPNVPSWQIFRHYRKEEEEKED